MSVVNSPKAQNPCFELLGSREVMEMMATSLLLGGLPPTYKALPSHGMLGQGKNFTFWDEYSYFSDHLSRNLGEPFTEGMDIETAQDD